MVNFRFKLTGGKLDSEGYLPCRSKSCLARRIDFLRSLSSRQGFIRPIIAVSRLWCCCDNLGGDGGEVIWRGSRPRCWSRSRGWSTSPSNTLVPDDILVVLAKSENLAGRVYNAIGSHQSSSPNPRPSISRSPVAGLH